MPQLHALGFSALSAAIAALPANSVHISKNIMNLFIEGSFYRIFFNSLSELKQKESLE